MPSPTILELTQKLVNARERYNKLKAETTIAEKERKQLEQELFAQMENESCQNFKHDELGTFSRKEYVWCTISDNKKAFDYFRELGLFDDIMQLKPKNDRLNALIKENYLEKGDPVPEDKIGINVTIRPRIGRRK